MSDSWMHEPWACRSCRLEVAPTRSTCPYCAASQGRSAIARTPPAGSFEGIYTGETRLDAEREFDYESVIHTRNGYVPTRKSWQPHEWGPLRQFLAWVMWSNRYGEWREGRKPKGTLAVKYERVGSDQEGPPL